MTYFCQLVNTPADQFDWKFRFGFLARASKATPDVDTTNLRPYPAPRDHRGFDNSFFSCDEARLLPRNRFLRHCSDPLPSIADFATAIRVLSARHRQFIVLSKHLANQSPVRMSLYQQKPVISGMLDQASTSRCFKLASDQASILFGSTSRRRGLPKLWDSRLNCKRYSLSRNR